MPRNRIALRGEYTTLTQSLGKGLTRAEKRKKVQSHLHAKAERSGNAALAKAELSVLPGWAFKAMRDAADPVKGSAVPMSLDVRDQDEREKMIRGLRAAEASRGVKVALAERERHNAECGEGMEVPTALALTPSVAAAKQFIKPTDATAPLSKRVAKLQGKAKPSAGATHLRNASEIGAPFCRGNRWQAIVIGPSRVK